jgi:hypothetical protein
MAGNPGRANMIDATELLDARTSSDGKHLQLRLRDQSGQAMTFSLPARWLNTMLNAVPTSSGTETVHPLDSWNMDRIGNSEDLILTRRTPEDQAVSFAMKPWQVEGMATIATQTQYEITTKTTIH